MQPALRHPGALPLREGTHLSFHPRSQAVGSSCLRQRLGCALLLPGGQEGNPLPLPLQQGRLAGGGGSCRGLQHHTEPAGQGKIQACCALASVPAEALQLSRCPCIKLRVYFRRAVKPSLPANKGKCEKAEGLLLTWDDRMRA